MGFRKGQVHSRKHKLSKNIFEDDQVPGRPREKKPALKKALNLVESFKFSWWLY